MDKVMEGIETFFVQYAPKLMLFLWCSLIFNHMLRGLLWWPLLFVLIPLILLVKTAKRG